MNRSGFEWTKNDMNRMRKYAAAKMSSRQAAEKLGRTTGAVKYKAMVEGVSFSFINQPKGVQKRRFRKLRRG